MSITLIKGRPGAGKSYECVVFHILPSLKEGRKVVTNIPINIDYFIKVLGPDVSNLIEVVPFDFEEKEPYLSNPDDYKNYHEWRNDKGQGCLFVLDECHLLFPLNGRGKAQTDLAQEQIKFFSGHRHYGFDFIFLTQSDRKINRLIREDIEICIEVRKNRAIGDMSYRRYVYYYGDGKRTGLIDQDSRKYEDKYFNSYSSHTKSETSVKEAAIKDFKKWHQNWGVRFAFILIIFGIYNSYNLMSGILSTSEPLKKEDTSSKKESPSLSPKQSHVVSKPKVVSNSSFKGLPYGDFDLFIDGYSNSTQRGYDGKLREVKSFYFLALNKSKFELKIDMQDLYLAGYQLSVYNECLIKLSYGLDTKFIYCKGKQPTPTKETLSNPMDIVSIN